MYFSNSTICSGKNHTSMREKFGFDITWTPEEYAWRAGMWEVLGYPIDDGYETDAFLNIIYGLGKRTVAEGVQCVLKRYVNHFRFITELMDEQASGIPEPPSRITTKRVVFRRHGNKLKPIIRVNATDYGHEIVPFSGKNIFVSENG